MKVLICGDREWNDYQYILKVVQRLKTKYGEVTIIEGGCRGADILSKEAAIECNLTYKEYPADWTQGKKAGPIRNQRMLDEEHPDMVIAFHSNIDKSKGTKDMVRRAKKAGIPVYIFK